MAYTVKPDGTLRFEGDAAKWTRSFQDWFERDFADSSVSLERYFGYWAAALAVVAKRRWQREASGGEKVARIDALFRSDGSPPFDQFAVISLLSEMVETPDRFLADVGEQLRNGARKLKNDPELPVLMSPGEFADRVVASQRERGLLPNDDQDQAEARLFNECLDELESRAAALLEQVLPSEDLKVAASVLRRLSEGIDATPQSFEEINAHFQLRYVFRLAAAEVSDKFGLDLRPDWHDLL